MVLKCKKTFLKDELLSTYFVRSKSELLEGFDYEYTYGIVSKRYWINGNEIGFEIWEGDKYYYI